MDLDETCDESQEQRPLRGFRKRWLPEATALDEPSPRPLSEDVGEGLNQESQFDLFGGNYAESLEPEPSLLDWDLVEQTGDAGDVLHADSLKRVFEPAEDLTEPVTGPQVLDPLRTESVWKAEALAAEVKRARTSFAKLPWEVDGSVFQIT